MKDTGDGARLRGRARRARRRDARSTATARSPSSTPRTSTCDNAGANTDAAGQCTITFTSNSAGKVTGHATATLVGQRLGAVHGRDRRRRPELGRRGQDVRRREHPDHAGDGDQPGRHEPRPDRSRERQHRHRRLPSNAPDGTDDQLHPGQLGRRHGVVRRPGHLHRRRNGTRLVHGHDQLLDGRARPRSRRSPTCRSAACRSIGRPVTARSATASMPTSRGSTRGSPIAPNATNEVGAPHTFTVTLLKDTGRHASCRPPVSTSR